MIRRLIVACTAAIVTATPALAAPAGYGPADGWQAERERLETRRRDPGVTTALNLLWPGIGTAYAGDTGKAIAQAAGAFGVMGAALLLSTWVRSVTSSPEIAVILAVSPTPAYWAWAATDGYHSVATRNQQIEWQQKLLTTPGVTVPVLTF